MKEKDRINLDNPSYNQNQNRVVIQDNKAKILWAILGIIAAVIIVVVAISSGSGGSTGGNSNSNILDPNRTTEPCSRYGETRVFGAQHDSSCCYPDYDGYYHVSFGHHHHK